MDLKIFYEVTWHSVHEGIGRHGEVDIVVLSPTGNMLLMEIKTGQVLLREGGIFIYQLAAEAYHQDSEKFIPKYDVLVILINAVE